MTQPIIDVPATPVPETPAPPEGYGAPQAPSSPLKPTTIRDVVRRIEDYADADNLSRLPSTRMYVWHPRYSAPEAALLLQAIDGNRNLPDDQKVAQSTDVVRLMRPTVFTPGKVCPLDDKLTVMWIFPHERGVHVYALPLQGGADNDATKLGEQRPTRYLLSPSGGQCAVQTMPLDTWMLEVADELDAVDRDTAFFDPTANDEEEDPEE